MPANSASALVADPQRGGREHHERDRPAPCHLLARDVTHDHERGRDGHPSGGDAEHRQREGSAVADSLQCPCEQRDAGRMTLHVDRVARDVLREPTEERVERLDPGHHLEVLPRAREDHGDPVGAPHERKRDRPRVSAPQAHVTTSRRHSSRRAKRSAPQIVPPPSSTAHRSDRCSSGSNIPCGMARRRDVARRCRSSPTAPTGARGRPPRPRPRARAWLLIDEPARNDSSGRDLDRGRHGHAPGESFDAAVAGVSRSND